jgi:hypothetical protein
MRLVVALGLLLTACKGDMQKCEQACRNYGTLMYWQHADAEIAAAPPAERDALRKRRLGEFEAKLENGVDMCVSQCQSANNDKDMDCMIAAKTADQVKACTTN